MASAKKLPSGNWRVNLYIGLDENGKRRYKSFTADTKKEAELLAAQYNVDRREQEHCELTLRAAAERYIESKRNVLSPMTIRGYESVLRCYMGDIMPLKVSDITQEALQLSVNAMAKTVAAKTCRNAHGFVTAVLAVYRPNFTPRTSLPKSKKRDIYVPDSQEVIDILKRVKGSANELPVFLAAECGLRAEEIAGLRLENVHTDHIDVKEAIVIDSDLNQVVKLPKSTSGYRSIPITEEAYKYIVERADTDDRVCNRSNEMISNNWGRYRREHKGISPHLNFHAFRHHYASKLLLLGIPQKYIAELMGHGSTDMIEKVYQHIFPSAMEHYQELIRESMQHEMQHEKL